MLKDIMTVGSKHVFNMLTRNSKWLSNVRASYFSEKAELEKVYVRFLINRHSKLQRVLKKLKLKRFNTHFI